MSDLSVAHSAQLHLTIAGVQQARQRLRMVASECKLLSTDEGRDRLQALRSSLNELQALLEQIERGEQ